MFKFKFDTSDLDPKELLAGIKSRFNTAVGTLMQNVQQEADKLSASKLKSGLKHWKNGFKIHKVSDDFFVISIDGKLANWMEEGIQAGEISKSIMNGNRAESNKAKGKNYVDVPFAKDADALGNITLGKNGPKVNVKAFNNADSLTKYMSSSDWKKGGVRKEKIVQQRVQDILKTTKVATKETSFVTIRRVSDKSIWPKSPYAGAKVLESLDLYIDSNWDKILEQVM